MYCIVFFLLFLFKKNCEPIFFLKVYYILLISYILFSFLYLNCFFNYNNTHLKNVNTNTGSVSLGQGPVGSMYTDITSLKYFYTLGKNILGYLPRLIPSLIKHWKVIIVQSYNIPGKNNLQGVKVAQTNNIPVKNNDQGG